MLPLLPSQVQAKTVSTDISSDDGRGRQSDGFGMTMEGLQVSPSASAAPATVTARGARRKSSRPVAGPVAVFVAGLLITTGICVQNLLFNRRYHEQAEIALLDDVADAVVATLNTISASVTSFSSMAEVYGSLTPERFNHYVEDLRNNDQLPPGILGLGYARYVRLEDKSGFETSLKKLYGQSAQIRPAGHRSAYAPVTNIQPLGHLNRQAIGFDLLSEPIRRQALVDAARIGIPVLTAKLELKQNPLGNHEAGVILYSVIRSERHNLVSHNQGLQDDVWGWAAIPFRINDLMRETLRQIDNPNLQGSVVLLFDGDRPSRYSRLYDPVDVFDTPKLTDPNYQRITVGGRTWVVGVQLTRVLPGPDGLHWSQALILLVGALLSALAAVVTRELLLSHERTVEAMNQLALAAEDKAIAAAVFEGTAEGVVITNPDGLVQSLNQSFTQLTGFTNLDLRGRSLRALRSGKHDDGFYQNLWDDLRHVGTWRQEVWNRCKDGQIRLHDVSITTVADHELQPLHYVAIYQDITIRHGEQQSILFRATHDGLTGLANRTQLMDRLEQALSLADRYDNKVGLLYMDLNGFKAVNDKFGHEVGDALLIAVSRRLETFLRKTDTLSRQGGDEFVLLLPSAPDMSGLMVLAERIQAELRQPFSGVHDSELLVISVSIGIARWPEHGDNSNALIQTADQAMYRCKNSDDRKPVMASVNP